MTRKALCKCKSRTLNLACSFVVFIHLSIKTLICNFNTKLNSSLPPVVSELAPCLLLLLYLVFQIYSLTRFFPFCFCCPIKVLTRHVCPAHIPCINKKLKMNVTHRDLEGTVRDVLPSKTHADDILARLRCCVEDVKRAVLVFHNVHIEFGPLGGAHAACHLAFPSSLCVHCDDCLFTNLDCRTNTGTLRIGKRRSVVRCDLLLLSLHTRPFIHTHNNLHAHSTSMRPG